MKYTLITLIILYTFIILFILIIIICCILPVNNLIYINCERFSNKNDDFIAITYETDANNEELNNLIKMFQKNNYNYNILGNGDVWNSWYGRSQSYINYINTLDSNTYIILCDARDVIVNQPFDVFIETALRIRNKYGDKIIVGTEKGCCTGSLNDNIYRAKNIPNTVTDFQELYINQQKENSTKYNDYKFDYINFGLMFGKAYEFINLFNHLNIQPDQDDQALLNKVYYENPELLYLDHNQELFSNASNSNSYPIRPTDDNYCHYEWDIDHNAFKNIYTNTYPCIIQTPGKNWQCYNFLVEKIV